MIYTTITVIYTKITVIHTKITVVYTKITVIYTQRSGPAGRAGRAGRIWENFVFSLLGLRLFFQGERGLRLILVVTKEINRRCATGWGAFKKITVGF